MSGLIRGSGQAAGTPKVTGIPVQTSVLGKCIPIVFGLCRIAGNLIWYGDFGKVGGVGTGKGALITGKSGSAPYQAAVAIALCEGPIAGIGTVFAGKKLTTVGALGFSVFTGSYSQNPWGYLTSNHPGQDLNYRGLAYLAASTYPLDSSGSLPNHSMEVRGFGWGAAVTGIPDADPRLVINQLVTNQIWGAGSYYPSSHLAALTKFQDYCFANSLFISIAYESQRPLRDMMQEIADGCNSDWVYINDALDLIPRGDATVSGHGHTYTPPQAPEFDLGDDDYFPANKTDEPVKRQRQRPADQINDIVREFKSRLNYYNPMPAEARHQAYIDQYGLRQESSKARDIFAVEAYARLSAQLELQRQSVRNIYTFRLDARYSCLDPTDIVSLTDSNLGLNKQWVKIRTMTEDSDDGFTVTAEEYLGGTGAAAQYSIDSGTPFVADYNSAPDATSPPVFLEPPQGLVTDSEVWVGIAGVGPNWGGAEVWVSTDGTEYQLVDVITAAAVMGDLTAPLPAFPAAPVGQTIDQTNTLSGDLTESRGSLTTSSVANATALNTLCLVDTEIVAFANAALTSSFNYNLTYLVRGNFNTVPGAHGSGTDFLRLPTSKDNAGDFGIFRYVYTPNRLNQTIYVKLPARNVYGGGQQTPDEVAPYTYTITGQASIAAPLENVTNFRTAFVDGKLWLYWDDVVGDNRITGYEIRKGSTWAGAQFLQRVAHPPVPAYGDDTYWVAAFGEPLTGINLYSPSPSSLTILGSALVANVVATHDEAATGWSGTLDPSLSISGPDIRTSAGQTSGYYYAPVSHRVAIGRATYCPVAINWALIGQFDSADFLGNPDFLGQGDFLGFSATAQVFGFPEIRLSQDFGATWGPWIKFAPGVYLFTNIDYRIQIGTNNPGVISAYLTAFAISVNAPVRTDFYPNVATSASVDVTTTFTPSPFNGGPGGGTVPSWTGSIRDSAPGDNLVLAPATLSLTSITFSVYNGGVRVVRHVDLTIQGY